MHPKLLHFSCTTYRAQSVVYGLLCLLLNQDFAVLRFVEHTASASYDAINCASYRPSAAYMKKLREAQRGATGEEQFSRPSPLIHSATTCC